MKQAAGGTWRPEVPAGDGAAGTSGDQSPGPLAAETHGTQAGTSRPGASDGPAGWAHALHRVPGWLAAGVIYLGGGVAMWWQVWTGHPSSTLTCSCGDPPSFVWFLAWPVYAVTHGHSLFLAAQAHVPGGINLLDNTSVLALGVALAPVTWLFGPVTSLNVALTAALVLTAWSAYACLRRALGLRWAAAFAGGLLFGFSPFMLRNEAANHLQTSFLALVPLIFWCCYELAVTQRGKWWRWGLFLGVLIFVQFFIGTDILAVTAITAMLALLLAALAALSNRRTLLARLPYALRGFGLALAVSGVLLAYPLWFALAGPQHITGLNWPHSARGGLGQVLFPQGPTPSQENAWHIGGYLGQVGVFEGYLGIPALIVLAVAVIAVRRPLLKLCGAMTVIAVWLSLGGSPLPASQGGEPSWLWLPWSGLDHLPVLDKLTPATFSASAVWFVVLAVALLVDHLLPPYQAAPSRGTRRRWLRITQVPFARPALAGAAGVAVLASWLITWHVPYATEPVTTPPWATRDGAHLPASAVVLFYPFPATYQDQALIWQAESGMRYAVVSGRGITATGSGTADHGWTRGSQERLMSALTVSDVPGAFLALPQLPGRGAIQSFRSALRRWGVTNVVITAGGRDPAYARRWLTVMMGTPPRLQDGAWVWTNVRKLIW